MVFERHAICLAYLCCGSFMFEWSGVEWRIILIFSVFKSVEWTGVEWSGAFSPLTSAYGIRPTTALPVLTVDACIATASTV